METIKKGAVTGRREESCRGSNLGYPRCYVAPGAPDNGHNFSLVKSDTKQHATAGTKNLVA
jgi:hypothetical protein